MPSSDDDDPAQHESPAENFNTIHTPEASAPPSPPSEGTRGRPAPDQPSRCAPGIPPSAQEAVPSRTETIVSDRDRDRDRGCVHVERAAERLCDASASRSHANSPTTVSALKRDSVDPLHMPAAPLVSPPAPAVPIAQPRVISERKPLLDSSVKRDVIHLEHGQATVSPRHPRRWRGVLCKELKSLARLASMTSLTTLFSLVIFSTDTAFLGHLGTNELAGSALAQVFMMLSTLFMYGMASTINTLASQAFGAGNLMLVGTWFQVSLVGTTVLSVPVILIFWFSGKLVALVEDDESVVHYASIFARWSCLTVWPNGIFAATCQYFQVQNIVVPPAAVNFVAIFVNLGFNQLFIHGALGWNGFGFIGSPLATAATSIFRLLVIFAYTMWLRGLHKRTWPGWRFKEVTWSRVLVFMKMSLPTGLALVFDESVFQALVLMAGRLSETDVAALGIVFNLFSFVWGMWWGVGLATQVRVGYNLGAGKPFTAKVAFLIGSVLTLLLNVAVFAACISLRGYLAVPFSSSPTVQAAVGDMAEVMALCFTAYCFAGSVLSTLEGMGRIMVMAGLQLTFAYALSLPLAYELCFKMGYGSQGLLLGTGIGDAFKFVCAFVYFAVSTNWRREVSDAMERSECEDDSGVNSGSDRDSEDGGGAGNGNRGIATSGDDAGGLRARRGFRTRTKGRRRAAVARPSIDEDMDEHTPLIN